MESRVRVNDGLGVSSRLVPITHTLIAATTLGTAETIYTVRDEVAVVVERIAVANTSASSVNLTIHSVPPGGTASTATTEIPTVPIAGNTVVEMTELIGGLYDRGSTLQAFASTADVLVVHGYVREIL